MSNRFFVSEEIADLIDETQFQTEDEEVEAKKGLDAPILLVLFGGERVSGLSAVLDEYSMGSGHEYAYFFKFTFDTIDLVAFTKSIPDIETIKVFVGTQQIAEYDVSEKEFSGLHVVQDIITCRSQVSITYL